MFQLPMYAYPTIGLIIQVVSSECFNMIPSGFVPGAGLVTNCPVWYKILSVLLKVFLNIDSVSSFIKKWESTH